MLGAFHPGFPLHLATIVAPVAGYFLILGLLNSRSRPQMLRGRNDFALLVGALSPLFLAPAWPLLAGSPVRIFVAGIAVLAGIWAVAPRGASWVIYNISLPAATRLVERTLQRMGLNPERIRRGEFHLADENITLRITSFALLRNVSVRVEGDAKATKALGGRLEYALDAALAEVPAETSPMAMAMLLAATAMLVVPLALVSRQAGEIVRLLSDLLN